MGIISKIRSWPRWATIGGAAAVALLVLALVVSRDGGGRPAASGPSSTTTAPTTTSSPQDTTPTTATPDTVAPAPEGGAGAVADSGAQGTPLPVEDPGVAPASPRAPICDNAGVLTGPSAPPAGAVVVPAGNNASVFETWYIAPSTTYWFAPGVHTLDHDQFGQISPQDNDVFVGAPGAVLDGQGINQAAFTGNASGVTIRYLTIQNFDGPHDQGVVNHDMANGWTVEFITAQNNHGAAVFVSNNGTLRYSCLRNNGQYGFQGLGPVNATNLVMDHNEIAGNNSDNTDPDCGCSGGGKFWDAHNAQVTNNWVHDNRGAGLWADTNNSGFNFQGNYISDNDGEGILYEISYNAQIKANTFVRNALDAGPKNPGFPTGAIYLSESGSDPRVPGPYGNEFLITGNVFTDNWSGVVLWENADRFCGSDANSSTGYCTMVDPGRSNLRTCAPGTINSAPYYFDCRWKTQNVQVIGNLFTFSPANIGRGCTPDNSCGQQGVFSNAGSVPDWSPYHGEVIRESISSSQGNVFAGNTYVGPWTFMVYDQAHVVDFSTWQSGWGQDGGSAYG